MPARLLHRALSLTLPRPDVLIHPEEVMWIVLRLDLSQPRIAMA
jgi:hypothetical protein